MKMFKWLILCILILSVAVGLYLKIISAQEQVTGGEFIVKLAQAIGLDFKLGTGATAADYIALLREEGFEIPLDFDPSKPIKEEQKADLLSQVLRIDELKRTNAQVEAYRNKAVIEKIEGEVLVKRAETDQWVPAQVDMVLTEKDYIKTGPASTASLRIGVAGKIEIRENSELQLKTLSTQADKKAETILLYLACGEMKVDVRYIHKDTTFDTHTPTTVAAVRGTIYVIKVLPVEGKTEIKQ